MSIDPGDVLKIVAILSFLDGNIVQNVFSSVIGGTGGPYDEPDIVDDALVWVQAMYANLVADMADTIDGSEIKVYVYDAIDDDYDEIGSLAWTFNPTGTADTLPRGVAALINAKTTDPDVNGKKYIGGLTEAVSGSAIWTPGFVTNLADFAVDWLSGFTGSVSGATWVPGIWSPTRTTFYAASGSFLVPAIPAYQRRRKQGVGI